MSWTNQSPASQMSAYSVYFCFFFTYEFWDLFFHYRLTFKKAMSKRWGDNENCEPQQYYHMELAG